MIIPPGIPLIVLDLSCSRISNIDPENDMAPVEFDTISGIAAGVKPKTNKKPKQRRKWLNYRYYKIKIDYKY